MRFTKCSVAKEALGEKRSFGVGIQRKDGN